eukprot:SM000094S24687  [mRNA]  locus=s94:177317:179417:- [translate_table: standard]
MRPIARPLTPPSTGAASGTPAPRAWLGRAQICRIAAAVAAPAARISASQEAHLDALPGWGVAPLSLQDNDDTPDNGCAACETESVAAAAGAAGPLEEQDAVGFLAAQAPFELASPDASPASTSSSGSDGGARSAPSDAKRRRLSALQQTDEPESRQRSGCATDAHSIPAGQLNLQPLTQPPDQARNSAGDSGSSGNDGGNRASCGGSDREVEGTASQLQQSTKAAAGRSASTGAAAVDAPEQGGTPTPVVAASGALEDVGSGCTSDTDDDGNSHESPGCETYPRTVMDVLRQRHSLHGWDPGDEPAAGGDCGGTVGSADWLKVLYQ